MVPNDHSFLSLAPDRTKLSARFLTLSCGGGLWQWPTSKPRNMYKERAQILRLSKKVLQSLYTNKYYLMSFALPVHTSNVYETSRLSKALEVQKQLRSSVHPKL